MKHTAAIVAGTLILLLVISAAAAQGRSRGIVGRTAPELGVGSWINLPEGRTTVDLADYRGRVVYLYCFQSWCPGCHSRGFPTLRSLIDRYEGNDDVAFLAVQTVFEGFTTNTPEAARRTARRYDLSIPVGHDGSAGAPSKLMRRYRTGGTPWTVIIDREGVVRYDGFHATVAEAGTLIDRLRTSATTPAPAPAPVVTLPAARGGQDLLGTTLPRLEFDRIVARPGETAPPAGMKPIATLYRWWTDGCPHCTASLPGFERLRARYGEMGLRVVAVYHPKPPHTVPDAEVTEMAKAKGYRGSIAIDEDWSELRRFYLDTGKRAATSAAFLVDRAGRIRFVHPGPRVYPSKDPDSAQENADYRLLEGAVRSVLREAG